MQSPLKKITHFSRAKTSQSFCVRPDTEQELASYLAHQNPQNLLARGAGLSYNDSCFNSQKLIIDTQHLNHFIDFDDTTGIALCQAHVTFLELLYLHPNFIPPVLPGTLHATLAGGVAHDVHGKNNPHAGSLGHHIECLELLINNQKYRCSPKEQASLFYATIGGLGLTGIITRVGIRLKKISSSVRVERERYSTIHALLQRMITHGVHYDYQVAWLDLLNKNPKGILSLATHDAKQVTDLFKVRSIPKIPLKAINKWTMRGFNSYYYAHSQQQELMSIERFNNPLDTLKHWNYLYGRNGLIQCQILFPTDKAESIIEALLHLIKQKRAIPTLAVLKLFTQKGLGLLSFCTQGVTLAIDFINNEHAQQAIGAINQLMTEQGGRIYLAKDLLCTPAQFRSMYPNHESFTHLLSEYHSPMSSDLSRRLEITQ